jgi:hypothetical protein
LQAPLAIGRFRGDLQLRIGFDDPTKPAEKLDGRQLSIFESGNALRCSAFNSIHTLKVVPCPGADSIIAINVVRRLLVQMRWTQIVKTSFSPNLTANNRPCSA